MLTMFQSNLRCLSSVLFVAMLVTSIACAQSTTTMNNDAHCGAKCLYVLLRDKGVGPADYRSFIRELGAPGKKGYSLLQLRDAARKYVPYAECATIHLTDLPKLSPSLGVIMHFNPGHYVVFQKSQMGQNLLLEATEGRPFIASKDFMNNWSGNVLVISDRESQLFSTSFLPWGKYLFAGLAFGCFALGLFWLARRRLAAIVLVGLTLGVAGCGAKSTDVSMPSLEQENVLWIEQPNIDIEPILNVRRFHLVKIPLSNRGTTDIRIDDVRLSCHCASAGFSSQTVKAGETADLLLRLDCNQLGRHGVNCTLISGGRPVGRVSARWSVIAGLIAEPSDLYDIELEGGQTVESVVRLKGKEGVDLRALKVDFAIDARSRDYRSLLQTKSIVHEDSCVLTFSADPSVNRGSIGGHVHLIHPEANELEAIIPFRIVIKNRVDLLPTSLYLTKTDDGLTSQVVILTEEVKLLDPMELKWITKDSSSPCDAVFEDRDGSRIIDLTLSPDVGRNVTHLQLTLGGTIIRQIPAFLP